ncbi:hypothetical protein K1719_024061 [Acacia pycnantha]|nr:hypothetical protein K1719_024061 [Acacia pycnantha]
MEGEGDRQDRRRERMIKGLLYLTHRLRAMVNGQIATEDEGEEDEDGAVRQLFFQCLLKWSFKPSAVRMWKGFLGSSLSSADLVLFAFYMFIIAPHNLRMLLARHLLSDPTGATMIRTYLTL